jgi:glycosyltransferase involved in cell wall biosynthesis
MGDRKKIVFCTDGIFPHAVGGMQRHSLLLIEELSRVNKFDIVVIHPHASKVLDSQFAITEVALNYQNRKKNYLHDCYNYSKKVYSALKAHPDAIIYSQGLSVWYKIRQIGNRVIVNPHGLEPFQTTDYVSYLKTAPLRLVFRYIYKRCSTIISLGGKLTDILSSIAGRSKIVVIPNAVNIVETPVRSFDKDKLDLLFVGRFAPNKGIHILMKAVEDLNKEGYSQRLRFHLVGKGPLYEEYIQKYKFPNVEFHGFASDEQLAKMYKTYDLFIFPTLYEGMPTVVLEAMVQGMPVIVSDTGATGELVDPSTGYLIEKNNLRALKWAVQSFYQLLPEQRLKLSEASYQKVKNNFTWPVVARMHAELFNNFNVVK